MATLPIRITADAIFLWERIEILTIPTACPIVMLAWVRCCRIADCRLMG